MEGQKGRASWALWAAMVLLAAAVFGPAGGVSPLGGFAVEAAAPGAEGAGTGVPLDGGALSLQDALRLALDQSTAVALAKITLEEARLTYEEAKANHLLRPSVVALQQAESAWSVAQRNYELALQDLMLQVEQAYYDVLKADLALDLAERTLAQSRGQLESTRARFEQGMLSHVDVLAAEMQVANAEVELNRARATVATSRMAFNRLLGRDLDAPVTLVDDLAYEPLELDLEGALATALDQRLELQRARDTVRLRETELRVSENPYTPQLTAERARVALQRARVELAEREADIILEIRRNYQAVVEAEARIPIQRTNLERARENLRISEARYEAGVITAIDLVDAQRTAFEAETRAIEAEFDYKVALARFLRSTGQAPGMEGIPGRE